MRFRYACVVFAGLLCVMATGWCRAGAEIEPARWYEPEIRAFEEADRASPPEPGAVLFIGSSSIRMWETLERDMAPARVLKRGFGGSTTRDVLEVFDRIVAPYEPRAIVYYCGDNDLGTTNKDAEGVAARFIEFEQRARASWPEVEVMYIAIKPSIARWSNWESMKRANEIVRGYCERTPGATFLDIATPMLGADGKPDSKLFANDGLHLNEKGYEVWAGVVKGEVMRVWDKRYCLDGLVSGGLQRHHLARVVAQISTLLRESCSSDLHHQALPSEQHGFAVRFLEDSSGLYLMFNTNPPP